MSDMGLAHSIDYDRGEPCRWCGKTEDGGLDCTGPTSENRPRSLLDGPSASTIERMRASRTRTKPDADLVRRLNDSKFWPARP